MAENRFDGAGAVLARCAEFARRRPGSLVSWRRARPLAALLALVLAACGGGEARRVQALDCPNVLLLDKAETLKRFASGRGRDVTDVLFNAGIVDFHGTCDYDKDDSEVEVELFVTFFVQRGPANTAQRADFDYFVAIPRFFPAPEGKRQFRVTVPFGDNRSRVVYRDQVDMKIPLKKGERASAYDVYVGFQLTRAEANERSRPR